MLEIITGIFEQCHFLMGFEDTLTNLYEHPDEMRQLIEYITEYRLRYVQLLIDRLQPDVIFSHDDWGTKDALFMHPDMWREFFKEPYRRFYGYIPLPGRHRHPPRGFLSGAHCGGYGGDRHSGVAGCAAGE